MNLADRRELWFRCDAAGTVMEVLGALQDMLGIETDEVVGRHLADFVEPEDRLYLAASLKDPERHQRECLYIEVRVERESGENVCFDMSARAADDGMLWIIFRHLDETEEMNAKCPQSADLLRKAERLSRVGFWDWQIDSGELFWTEGIYNLFGFQKQDFSPTFEGFIALIDERDRRYVQESVKVAVEDGVLYSIQHRVRRMDGEVIWVQETGEIQCNAAGDPVRMYGTTRDISDQKKAEETEIRLTALLERTHDLVSIVDAWGNVIYLNPAGRLALGYGMEEDLSHIGAWDFHPVWWHKKIQDEILPEFQESDFWEGRTWLMHRDGRELPGWQVWMVFRDEQEKVIYHTTVIRDLSRMLVESEHISGQILDGLILALDHAEVVLWGLDMEGQIRFAYGRGLRHLGLQAEECPDKSIPELLSENQDFRKHWPLGIDGKETKSTFRINNVLLENSFCFTLDDNGNPDGLVGVSFFPEVSAAQDD